MARFYGSMQGNRGEATRMGTPNSGLSAHIRGWDIGVRVELSVDEATGKDRVTLHQTSGSNSHEPDVRLMSFTADEID